MYSIVSAMFLGLFVGACGALLIYRFGSKLGLLDVPGERSSHSVPVSRSGGVGILLSFLVAGCLITKDPVFVILAGSAGLLGLLEDFFTFSSRSRLGIQFLISALLCLHFFGMPTTIQTVAIFLFYLAFITGTANFYNFMDGINGLAGLSGVVALGFIAYVSIYMVNEPDIALMSLVISSACLGFIPFNFPKAKIFMGDVGSLFLGFVFASFVVKLSINISMFLCIIMFLCMFYADALVTIFYRWKRGENLIVAHRSHLYQYMCNELKIQHWKVSIAYALIQFVFALLALLAYKQGIIWQIVLFVSFAVFSLVVYKFVKRIKPGLRPGYQDVSYQIKV